MRPSRIALLVAASIVASGCASKDAVGTPPSPSFGPIGERADLPVDGRLQIDGLTAPVDVVRDKWGRPHIYASNVEDAVRAEGYLVALDRHLELEFFRRVSEGRLAEILAQTQPSLIDVDISYRHLGLQRVAQQQYDALAPGDEVRGVLDAYADGISQAFRKIRSKAIRLPAGILGIDPSAFTDWSAVDTLAIGRLETQLLSYDADLDMDRQLFVSAARDAFKATDADPAVAKRAGLERDMMRFAPMDPTTTTTGYPMTSAALVKPPPSNAPKLDPKAFVHAMRGYLDARHLARSWLNPDGFGSNDWAISKGRSATGNPLVASDPHLQLSAPSIFWPVSIEVKGAKPDATKDLVVAGIAFPGIPGIILGHNQHIAWGATVAGYDVSDAYMETLGKDGDSVVFNGKTVPLQTIDEVINIQGRAPYTYHVKVVPHHGPIFPNIQTGHTVAPISASTPTISIRWTGMEPTAEISAVFQLLRATDVDGARTALKQFGVGAQNWMLGDTSGNILWTSHANVPIRDKRAFTWDPATYTGTLPCLVLPGDGSAEWKGYLPDDMVPWAKNPAAGFLSTANNDPIGATLDNDPSNDALPDGTPMYIGCEFDIGYRQGRIQSRIKAHAAPFATADLSAIQGDVRSPTGAALASALMTAIEQAEAERTTPGTHADLSAIVKDPAYASAAVMKVHDALDAWGKTSDFAAMSGIDPDTNLPLPATGASAAEAQAAEATLLFNAWLVRVIGRVFDDEVAALGPVTIDRAEHAKALLRLVAADPKTLATYDAATGDSALWDDLGTKSIVESRHERMIRALLDALGDLGKTDGADLGAYRWGAHHTITFTALISLFGKLSIPPNDDTTFVNGFPRHGDSFCVDAADYAYAGLGEPYDFTYAHGPTQRFVVDMDPSGPKAWNAMPGGVIWDSKSPHFRDEAEFWRRNQTHPVPFLLPDVIAAKESRTVVSSGKE